MWVSAHQAGDFLFRAGSATVRPKADLENVLGLGRWMPKMTLSLV
nr:hypothetical protein SYMBAF_50495 [Serratia symbiotica]